ncbi:unnamed protein product [Ectocarpus fasciculatus]
MMLVRPVPPPCCMLYAVCSSYCLRPLCFSFLLIFPAFLSCSSCLLYLWLGTSFPVLFYFAVCLLPLLPLCSVASITPMLWCVVLGAGRLSFDIFYGIFYFVFAPRPALHSPWECGTVWGCLVGENPARNPPAL